MMTIPERRDAAILAERGLGNQPIELMQAAWDGHRSVRVFAGKKHRGLATTAYSYALTDAEKVAVAARIAALWNLAAATGWNTEQIADMAATASKSRCPARRPA